MSMKWGELREEEFDAAIEKSGGLCMIPIGCYEMHGEHLPVRTDVFEAEAIAWAASEIEPAVVFPAFEFGDSNALVNRKGTIRLDPEVMMKVAENFCTEIARHGFDRILFVNHHGGNLPFLDFFLNSLDYKQRDFTVLYTYPCPKFKDIYADIEANGLANYPELLPEDVEIIRDFLENNRTDGHGGFLETSLMLAIRPDLVKLDRMGAVDGKSKDVSYPLWNADLNSFYSLWSLNFPNSFAGEPVETNTRIGKVILRLSAESVANAAKVFKENNHLFKERIEKKREFYR